MAKLFVGHLPLDMDLDEFRSEFSRFGKIVDLNLPMDQSTSQPRGYGFVQYEQRSQADKALRQMHNAEIREKRLLVDWAGRENARLRDQRMKEDGESPGDGAGRGTVVGPPPIRARRRPPPPPIPAPPSPPPSLPPAPSHSPSRRGMKRARRGVSGGPPSVVGAEVPARSDLPERHQEEESPVETDFDRLFGAVQRYLSAKSELENAERELRELEVEFTSES